MAKRREYVPINLEKYDGKLNEQGAIVLKSSWEEHFAHIYCDMNPACVQWAYEPLRIPYNDPLTGRQTIYIPDFLMAVKMQSGRVVTSLCEIKPIHEAILEYARSRKDVALIAKNTAKWGAAQFWCSRRKNVQFMLLTEADLFPGWEPKPRKRTLRPYTPRRVKVK